MTFEEDYYHQRVQILVDTLVERTRNALLHNQKMWDQPENGVYEYSLTKTSIRIYSQSTSGGKPYILEVYNEFGDLVDRVSEDVWGGPVNLEELYTLVSQGEKQKAKDAALTEIFHELDIPEPPF